MTWNLRRLVGLGPLCALLTPALPVLLAMLVNSQRSNDDVLGVMMVAAGIMFIGSLVGSAIVACMGVALFSMGALLAEPPVIVLVAVGAGLYAAVAVHDLAGVLHRHPVVARPIWTRTAAATAVVVLLGAAVFAVSYLLAGLATWQSLTVPFGVVAIGFAAKTAADAHRSAARSLTGASRPRPDADR